MRIGFISTRLCGTDGVSLETDKWRRVLQRMGHETFFCAGELGGYAQNGTLIPLLHFAHPRIVALNRRAFGIGAERTGSLLRADIEQVSAELCPPLRRFILENRLNLLIIENALAIPMNLPLGACLAGLIGDLEIPAIAHNHDFFWERERFQGTPLLDFLETFFPPQLPNLRHVTINSIAQRRLLARRGIESLVIPNVHDFAHPPAGLDDYNRDFRAAIGLGPQDLLILQPTRVIRRKGIEMALELTSALGRENAHLIITHSATDEGRAYWHWLQHEARMLQVDLRLVDNFIGTRRSRRNGHKVYTLWDAYPHADLVTYPSLYEGFGNALLEAIYFRRPVVVNRYPVYSADIKPAGFEFVELAGFVDNSHVRQIKELLDNLARVAAVAERNYRVARQHFSFEILAEKLTLLL